MAVAVIARGDIVLVDLDAVRGSASSNRRPAVVVSHDALNEATFVLGRGIVTVVPLSSNITRVMPFQVLIEAGRSGLHHDSKAQAEQVRMVSVERLGATLGRLPRDLMQRLDQALRLHLDL